MSRCPLCGFELVTPSREWRYSVFNVKSFRCPNCGRWFREYYYGGFLNSY